MPKVLPSYGELNKIEVPSIQDRANFQNGSIAGILGSTIKQAFTPDAISNSGPYKAIVLKAESNTLTPEPGSWIYNYFRNIFGDANMPPIVRIKARIPELHAMLPIPNSIGENASQDDSVIIEMYPTFVAQEASIKQTPLPGEVVWVDFENKSDFTGGLYLGPVINGRVAVGPQTTKKTPANAFGEACTKSYKIQQPEGDKLPGVNKALSHTGLPLLPRKNKKKSLEYNKILQELGSSQEVIKRLDNSLKRHKFYSQAWVGTTNSNGQLDPDHPAGKRSTVIIVPDGVDFTLPLELIYYFHGMGGFNYDGEFSSRIVPKIKKLFESNRNFIFVVPELPWARTIRNYKAKGGDFAWNPNKSADNFSSFHGEVVNIIKKNFAANVNIGYKTIIAFSQGGSALKSAAVYGGLSGVKPNKIVFGDATYSDWLEQVWVQYARDNKDVEIDCVYGRRSSAYNKIASFLKDRATEIRKNIFIEHMDLDHANIGNEAIVFVPVNKKEEDKQQVIASLEEEKNNSLDFELQELPYSFEEEKSDFLNRNGSISPMPMENFKLSPSYIKKNSSGKGLKKNSTDAILAQSKPFTEARVVLDDYGSLPSNSDLLVAVPSSGGQTTKVHKLVASRFHAMNQAWLADNPGREPLKVASGHRTKKWSSLADYESAMWKKFPNGGPKEARKWVAYASPHETGLAIDIGSNGLYPSRATNEKQKETRCYKWLKDNAHKFGFTHYKVEAWHWECRLPKSCWASGTEFTSNFDTVVLNPGTTDQTIPKNTDYYFLMEDKSATACISNLGDIAIKTPEDLKEMTPENNLDVSFPGKPNTSGVLSKEEKSDLIKRLSKQLGLEPEIAYAFLKVESGGRSGFCANTGRPLIRFEPHVFASPERLKKWNIPESSIPWAGKTSSERKSRWEALGFKHGSNCGTNEREYVALAAAIKIHEEHAYCSISVGAAQIMGFNYRLVGFKSAKEMFEAYCKSESEQIIGFFKFVQKRAGGKLLQALKNKDLVAAALLYNGRGQQDLYASKIEKYYNEYKAKGLMV